MQVFHTHQQFKLHKESVFLDPLILEGQKDKEFKPYKNNFLSLITATTQNHNTKYDILICSYITFTLQNLNCPWGHPQTKRNEHIFITYRLYVQLIICTPIINIRDILNSLRTFRSLKGIQNSMKMRKLPVQSCIYAGVTMN